MPGMDGIEFLKRAQQLRPHLHVILMTAYATVETAVEAMKAGADDYLVKPFNIEELELRLHRARDTAAIKRELQSLRELLGRTDCRHGLVGDSQSIQSVRERIDLFAGHDAPVLITGETGTGKEVVARALHNASNRREREFVAIACGTIPAELAESELFGHEKGSFTGATGLRHGSFERADGGTLLLDDVDDLPLAIQVKLLRVLQEGTLLRVGGSRELKVDVRVIATTKVNLKVAVAQGKFRDDLYYRLGGLEIELPRLSDREQDVLLLADHFLRRNHDSRSPTDGEPQLSPEAAAALCRHSWPGNIRELKRTIETALILSRHGTILPAHLPSSLGQDGHHAVSPQLCTLNLDGLETLSLPDALDSVEKQIIEWAMIKAAGQQKRAAEFLQIPRTTLQSRIQRHGLLEA
ncbi:MAG: sigma-54-dependent Fis family transcriptional regulator [Planctomycetes bacterium]|nr:sigma-54-dependent Fis family transcriptional regulator [Planctomycetota bacterium]